MLRLSDQGTDFLGFGVGSDVFNNISNSESTVSVLPPQMLRRR
jgi:hypothetical protein